MKKFLLVLLVLVMVVCCFVSCGKDDKAEDTATGGATIDVAGHWVLVNVTKDVYGNVLKEVYADKYTHKMYIWEYEYTNYYGEFICTGSWKTIIDAEGNEQPDEPQVNVNGCTCTGSSGDAYNDVYPGYKVPNCTCKKGDSVTDKNQFKECVLFEDEDFGLKLTIVSGIAEDKNVFYKVKVENNSAYDLNIQLWANTINDKLNVDFATLCVDCDSGKMTYTNLEFYNYNLSPYNIEFENIDKIMFEVHLSSEDFMNTYLEGATATIEFKEN